MKFCIYAHTYISKFHFIFYYFLIYIELLYRNQQKCNQTKTCLTSKTQTITNMERKKSMTISDSLLFELKTLPFKVLISLETMNIFWLSSFVSLFILLTINNCKLGVVQGCFSISSTKSSTVPPLVASKGSEIDIEDVSCFKIKME